LTIHALTNSLDDRSKSDRCRRRPLRRRPRIYVHMSASQSTTDAKRLRRWHYSRRELLICEPTIRPLTRNSRFVARFRVSVKAYYTVHALEIETALQLRIEDWNSIEEDKVAGFRGSSLYFQFPIDCAISLLVSNTRYICTIFYSVK